MDPPLKKDRTLTIGYGASGDPPIVWTQGEQEVEVGFFKIFLFKGESVDLSHVDQASPLDHLSRAVKVKQRVPTSRCTWDTVTIPVVQSSSRVSFPML